MIDFNVSVSIIEPSFFRTKLVQDDTVFKSMQDMITNLPQAVKEEFGQEYFDAGTCAITHQIVSICI